MLHDLITGYLAPGLKELGFTRSGKSFFRPQPNWSVIEVQKSVKSTSDRLVFTINLGIASRRLLSFFSSSAKRPGIAECHWTERIGHLLPEHRDVWWSIDVGDPVEPLGRSVAEAIVSVGIPHLDQLVTDAALRDLWLSGVSPGLTEVQRLMNLSAMLGMIGPGEQLDPVTNELLRVSEGHVTRPMVSAHLRKLSQLA